MSDLDTIVTEELRAYCESLEKQVEEARIERDAARNRNEALTAALQEVRESFKHGWIRCGKTKGSPRLCPCDNCRRLTAALKAAEEK